MSRLILDAERLQMQKLADLLACRAMDPRNQSPIIVATEVQA